MLFILLYTTLKKIFNRNRSTSKSKFCLNYIKFQSYKIKKARERERKREMGTVLSSSSWIFTLVLNIINSYYLILSKSNHLLVIIQQIKSAIWTMNHQKQSHKLLRSKDSCAAPSDTIDRHVHRPNELMAHIGRLFISMILKTRAKPVSVSANGNYEAKRGHRYKRRERGWRRECVHAWVGSVALTQIARVRE